MKYQIIKDSDNWYKVYSINETTGAREYLAGSFELNHAKKKARTELNKTVPEIIEEGPIENMRVRDWWEPLFELFKGKTK